MLVHMAIGDAYGAGFEYVKSAEVRAHNHLQGYHRHPRHHGIEPGQYSDDTQMSLAVAEALLESVQPTPRHWAQHFCDCFHRDPRQGYASGFHAFLSQVTDGQQFLERIRPHSDKSGACMRALPIGLLPDVGQVLTLAEGQARVTHDTPGGVLSAQAVALAAHYYLYGLGPRPEVCEYVAAQIGGDWTGWRGKVGPPGLQAARAALSALRLYSSMAELLRHCVDYTGDVDTVACIALGAAACCPDYRRDLPGVLYENLENGAYGKDYLCSLQARLAQRFPGTTLT